MSKQPPMIRVTRHDDGRATVSINFPRSNMILSLSAAEFNEWKKAINAES